MYVCNVVCNVVCMYVCMHVCMYVCMCMYLQWNPSIVAGFHTGVGAPRDFPPPARVSPPQKLYMIMMLCNGSDL